MAKEYRTIDIALDGDFEGCAATLRADGISARIFVDLSSNSVERQMEAVKKLVVKHTFKDSDGQPVEDILDAPMDALSALVAKWGDAVSNLPPR
jgi:hypothetical protein